MAKAILTKTDGKKPVKLVTTFRHYRTGKLMHASDYGHRAWPIGSRSGSQRRAKASPKR